MSSNTEEQQEEVKETKEVTFKSRNVKRVNLRAKEKQQKVDSSDDDDDDDNNNKTLKRDDLISSNPSTSSSSKGITSSSASLVKGKEEKDLYIASRDAELKNGSEEATQERRDAIQAKKPSSSSSFSATPQNAPTNVRAICRFDYQADICKDYKETGFCGFGDSCIFLHDRSNQVSSWKLDKQWEERQAARKRKLEELENFMDSNQNNKNQDITFPEECSLCSKSFEDPIITQCGHYFCQSCANSHYQSKKSSSTPRCPTCSKPLNGIFNRAHKLIKHLESNKKLDNIQTKEIKFQSKGTWT